MSSSSQATLLILHDWATRQKLFKKQHFIRPEICLLTRIIRRVDCFQQKEASKLSYKLLGAFQLAWTVTDLIAAWRTVTFKPGPLKPEPRLARSDRERGIKADDLICADVKLTIGHGKKKNICSKNFKFFYPFICCGLTESCGSYCKHEFQRRLHKGTLNYSLGAYRAGVKSLVEWLIAYKITL